MAGTIITECPACFTRFKVTPGQLRLAGGKVRCGACLLVFKAGDPPPEEPKVAPYNPNPDVDFGDVDLDLPDADHDQQTSPTPPKAKPADKAKQTPPRQSNKTSQAQSHPLTRKKATATSQPKVRTESPGVRKAEKLSKQAKHPKAPSKTGAAQVSNGQPQKKAAKAPAKSTTEQTERTKPLSPVQVESSTASPRQKPSTKGQKVAAPEPLLPPQNIAAETDSNSNPLLDSLAVESIQFSAPRPAARPLHTTAWLLASTFAVLLLATQYFWFERHTLAWQEPWHKFYQAGCEVLQCQLPTRQLVTQIRSQQMVVQDHPDYQEALLIQLILENGALFDQPWPALELAFTDLKGRTVAQRRFQPAEYLNTGMVDLLTMPTGQPSQIQLEIMKPGTRAVSYALSIVKPDPAK